MLCLHSGITNQFLFKHWLQPMFVERKICYSALFTYLVGWHASAVSFPLSVILAQLACPLSDVMLCLHSGIPNLSLYKHWLQPMFVGRKVCYSALFTYLVGWLAGAVSFHLSDVILAQLACPSE